PDSARARRRQRCRHIRHAAIDPDANAVSWQGADRRSVERKTEKRHGRLIPVMLGHLAAIGCQPKRIRNFAAVDCRTREESITRQGAMGSAQLSEPRYEFDQLVVGILP